MNKIILSLLLLILVPDLRADPLVDKWYVGLSYGTKHFIAEETNDGPKEIPGSKFGLLGGYRLTKRINIEAGYAEHNSTSEDFCNMDNQCVNWRKDYKYSFAGVRVILFQGKKISGSVRLAALFGNFESNLESKSFTSFYPGFGIHWHINEKMTLSLDQEFAEYYVGFNHKRITSQLNLSLGLDF